MHSAALVSSCWSRTRSPRALVVLLPLGLLLAFGGCEKPPPPLSERPRPVRVALIGTGGSVAGKTFSGSIQSQDATQLSFRVGGTLTAVSVKRGDTVKKGKMIATLDDTDFRVQVAQIEAQRQSAATRRDNARTTLNRLEKLYESGGASLSDYDNAKSQARSAAAELGALNQQVRASRNQLKYTKLTAPFGGVLNAVNVRQGETIGAGKVIAVLSKGGDIEVQTAVPEAYISDIVVGTKATVEVSAMSDSELNGTVSEVAFASEGAATYPVVISLDAESDALRPGMAATVTFDLGDSGEQGLVVPAQAVGNSESGSFVFVIEPASGGADKAAASSGSSDAHYTVRKQPVSLGQLSGSFFELREGLAEGDRVATAGLSMLIEGMTVRLLSPE